MRSLVSTSERSGILGRMGDEFWSPRQELRRVPAGWVMPRTRFGNAQGAIVESKEGLQVWVRDGDQAVQVGLETSLTEAAWGIWRWGREDMFLRERRRPPA